MSNSPIEPRHDFRQAAMACFETYTALVESGFTETQALTLVGQMLRPTQGDS